MTPPRRKILFVSENVTLAQVVRLVVLAGSLDPERYDVHFAASEFPPFVFAGRRFEQHSLFTIDKDVVFKALAAGKRIYEERTLERYVEAELSLFDRVQPDLVVGDFRLSLATSTAVARVHHATLINAYWSPFAVRQEFPVPDHPIVKLLGERMTTKYFPVAMPKVFSHFASPVNRLRRKHGLPAIGSLLEVLTHGDHTLYVDTPSLVPVENAPETHRFLGPVIWSPDLPLDPKIAERPQGRPLIYVTLGSSGSLDVLPLVIDALADLPVDVVLSTLGRFCERSLPPHFSVHSLVPGDQVARRAALVISNGGSTTSYQALAEGTPVIGLPSNLDQYLAMTHMAKTGAAALVRARTATTRQIRDEVVKLLDDPGAKRAAEGVRDDFSTHDSARAFRQFVEHLDTTRRAA